MFFPVHVKQARAELVAPRKYARQFQDLDGFVAELGLMHEAMEDLTGLPCGGHDRLVLAFERGSYGALWAYADGAPGHHVGVPPATWPRLAAAANRRRMVSAMVHELGHVAFWWDWDRQVGAHYLMWGGAVEGTATPTGAYACVRYKRVPAWIDFPAGDRDWASLPDFVHDILRGGVEARRQGAAGQDSVGHQGHGVAASMVEATLWDLFFRVLGGYGPYRQVLHRYTTELRTPAQAALDDHAKMSGFFASLGQAAGLDLSPYLAEWGYDVEDVRAACRHLPACDAQLPDPPPPAYGAISDPGWA